MLNTILLFLVLRRMTKSLWPSAFVACLFAIHPLHVESVAWITERKDVLSTFFWILTMGAYSYYVEHPGFKRYVFVLLFFILGLMSKPMLITLPFVLLLLDYWPLKRFQAVTPDHKVQPEILKSETSDKQKKKSKKKNALAVQDTLEIKKPADSEYKGSLIYPLLREKIPLFALAIVSSILTYIAQQNRGLVMSFEELPLGVRMGNAFIAYIAYIEKMIWPGNLAVLYPHSGLLLSWQVWGSLFLLIAITLTIIWMAKRFPYLATGWLWYLGTLVPVIGIVQVATQAMADRFTYIPLIGLFIIAAWGVPDLLQKWKYRKKIIWTLSALIILCLSIITWTQVGYWKNSITLYDHALKVTKNNMFIYYNRGFYYHNLGNYSKAIEDYNRAIEIKPGFAWAYLNRGNAYNLLGNYTKAIENFDRAIEIKPGSALAYNNRGNTYNVLGNYKKAIENFDRAIEIKPRFALAYNNRGAAYLMLGNQDVGCSDARKACSLGKCQALEFAKGKGYCR
jgi:hypothetical protein